MKQCPTCKTQYVDDYMYCTACGTALVPIVESAAKSVAEKADVEKEAVIKSEVEPLHEDISTKNTKNSSTKNNVIVFAAILFAALSLGLALIALYYCNQYDYYRDEYQAAQKSYKKAANQLGELEDELENYQNELKNTDGLLGYASDTYYAEKSIVILSLSEGSQPLEICFKESGIVTYHIDDKYSGGIGAKWSEDEFNNKTNIIITPKSTGIYKISFSNKNNNDHFDVLIIVTE